MRDTKIAVGIIGCGTIGARIAAACRDLPKEKITLAGICDSDAGKAAALKDALNPHTEIPGGREPRPCLRSRRGRVGSTGGPDILGADELIKRCDLIIEAASAGISGDILDKCVKAGKDCMIMSVGGLIGREELLAAAEKSGVKVYIPSGALCGIDGLKSAAAGKINSITLTTRKPLKGLEGAPYLKEHNIDLSGITGERVVFEGSARDAIRGFPQNVNVAAVLSLAGLGADKTRVRIVTSPRYTANVHEVEVEGEFGKMFTRTENLPSSTNPKTSAMAFFSAIATLSGIMKSVKIGN